MKYLNIAFYHFFKIEKDIDEFTSEIQNKADSLNLLGSILVAPEGINCFVSGLKADIDEFKTYLKQTIPASHHVFKESWSNHKPFRRMKVRARDQIIVMEDKDIQPDEFTGPSISPTEFKKWYDEKKDMIVLDTRNEFEIRMGTFENAVDLKIDNFRYYPDKIKELPEAWKEKPIVMFCTGGIRCEKASPLMLKHGFKNVYQLEGGILNYFEQIGGDHYKGDCYVFDRRVTIKPNLDEGDAVECLRCGNPVTESEQKLPSYKFDECCPHCPPPEGNSPSI